MHLYMLFKLWIPVFPHPEFLSIEMIGGIINKFIKYGAKFCNRNLCDEIVIGGVEQHNQMLMVSIGWFDSKFEFFLPLYYRHARLLSTNRYFHLLIINGRMTGSNF